MKKSLFQSRVFRWGMFSLMVMVLLFAFSTQNAKADIKATAPFFAWDRTDTQFKNSNVDLWLDPDWWIPLIHEFGNDNDPYPNACGDGTSSIWAGELQMGLGFIDTTGGDGFQASREWTIVECDRNGDGSFDNKDYSVPVTEGAPFYGFTQWSGVGASTFYLITSDVETDCSNSTCAKELLTTMFVNLDPDCDNILGDANNSTYDIPAGGLCFYAEAQPSAVGSINWGGNLQARIITGGGDKTVNFNAQGPNAVTLNSFSASPSQNSIVMYILAGSILALIGLGTATFIQKRKNL